jgi:hypothetical protein
MQNRCISLVLKWALLNTMLHELFVLVLKNCTMIIIDVRNWMIHLFMSWMIFLLVFVALSRCMLIWCSSLRICFNMLNLLAWHNCRRIKADYSIYHVPIETLASTGDMLTISSNIDSVKNYLTNFNTAWLQVVNIHCSFCCLFCAVWRASLDGPRTLRIQLVLSANIHLSFSIFTVLLMAGLNLLHSHVLHSVCDHLESIWDSVSTDFF